MPLAALSPPGDSPASPFSRFKAWGTDHPDSGGGGARLLRSSSALHERGYTVRLPDGRERNTLASRLRLPLDSVEVGVEAPTTPARTLSFGPSLVRVTSTRKEPARTSTMGSTRSSPEIGAAMSEAVREKWLRLSELLHHRVGEEVDVYSLSALQKMRQARVLQGSGRKGLGRCVGHLQQAQPLPLEDEMSLKSTVRNCLKQQCRKLSSDLHHPPEQFGNADTLDWVEVWHRMKSHKAHRVPRKRPPGWPILGLTSVDTNTDFGDTDDPLTVEELHRLLLHLPRVDVARVWQMMDQMDPSSSGVTFAKFKAFASGQSLKVSPCGRGGGVHPRTPFSTLTTSDGVMSSSPTTAAREKQDLRRLQSNAKMEGNGWTPLHCAVLRNDRDELERLLRCGADRGARSLNGRTPLDLARHLDGQHHPAAAAAAGGNDGMRRRPSQSAAKGPRRPARREELIELLEGYWPEDLASHGQELTLDDHRDHHVFKDWGYTKRRF
jgi:hypothetical protein